MSCRESESLIKSWSMWDLARLAPEQANYLDWFLKGWVSFREEPKMKKKKEKLNDIRRCCLTSLLAYLLGVKNEMGMAICVVL